MERSSAAGHEGEDFNANALDHLLEIVSALDTPARIDRAAGEFTVYDVMKVTPDPVSAQSALRQRINKALSDMVDRGQLTRREALDRGRRCIAYKKIAGPDVKNAKQSRTII